MVFDEVNVRFSSLFDIINDDPCNVSTWNIKRVVSFKLLLLVGGMILGTFQLVCGGVFLVS
jgi:hypothetical protein